MIEIRNYKKVQNGQVLCTFDVAGYHQGMVYPNHSIRMGNKGTFLARPSYIKDQTVDGKKIWGQYPEFETNDERVKYTSDVMKALAQYETQGNQAAHQEIPF